MPAAASKGELNPHPNLATRLFSFVRAPRCHSRHTPFFLPPVSRVASLFVRRSFWFFFFSFLFSSSLSAPFSSPRLSRCV